MRMTELYAPTLRETPAEAEIVSHQLMLRAGLIHKVAMGIYSYMPVGWKVMKKVMNIIREEMDAAGGQEMFMSTVHPAELCGRILHPVGKRPPNYQGRSL